MRTSPGQSDLSGRLEHWVSTGIISSEQADRIRADADLTATPATPSTATTTPRGTSLVTEAMGYLGGVIILVGLGLVAGWFWDELPTAVRVGLAGVVAALMLVAGAAVPRGLAAVGVRLRSVLWLASSVATFFGLSLLANEGFGWDGNAVAVFAGGITAMTSAVMWAVHRRLLQHAVVLVLVLTTAGTTTALIADNFLAAMTVVWVVGAAWMALSWLDRLPPRHTGIVLGAVAAVVASLTLESEDWGTVLALLTVAALVAIAVSARDLVLLAVASLGTLAVLPSVIVRYFPGVLAAALALVIVGLLLVGAAIFTARHRPPRILPHA